MTNKTLKLLVSCFAVVAIIFMVSCNSGAAPEKKEADTGAPAPSVDTTHMDSADTRPVKAGN